jgi:hypothetical protein
MRRYLVRNPFCLTLIYPDYIFTKKREDGLYICTIVADRPCAQVCVMKTLNGCSILSPKTDDVKSYNSLYDAWNNDPSKVTISMHAPTGTSPVREYYPGGTTTIEPITRMSLRSELHQFNNNLNLIDYAKLSLHEQFKILITKVILELRVTIGH